MLFCALPKVQRLLCAFFLPKCRQQVQGYGSGRHSPRSSVGCPASQTLCCPWGLSGPGGSRARAAWGLEDLCPPASLLSASEASWEPPCAHLGVRAGLGAGEASRSHDPCPWEAPTDSPWLLSLRGEMVASLEDASLMGLYVDISATTITIQSPRQDLLQRREVLSTSVELLPLRLVSGHRAYSLEAACPPASAQPESELLVHVPKQRLGSVRRGSHIQESLSLTFLHVHPSGPFTVTESRDFVVVSLPAAGWLQGQQCQDAQGIPGTQAFYRVDLTLEFAEVAAPVLWTVENFFPCVASGTELPAAAATPKTVPSPKPPGPGTPPAGMPSAASALLQTAGSAALGGLREELSQGLARRPSNERADPSPSSCPPSTVSPTGSGPHQASADPAGPQAPPSHHCSSQESPPAAPSPVTSSSNSERSLEKAGGPKSSHLRAAPLPSVWPGSQPPSALRPNERRWGGGSAAAVHTDRRSETHTFPKGLMPGAPEPGLEKQLGVPAPTGPSLGHDPQGTRSPPALVSDAPLTAALSLKKELGSLLQTAKPAGRSWAAMAPISPRVVQDPSLAPLGEVGPPAHSLPPATLSSGSLGEVQARPGSPRPVFPDPTAPAVHLTSEVTSPQPPPRGFEQSKVSLVSGRPATLTDSLGTTRPTQDPAQLPGSPFLLGGLSGGHVAVTEPIWGRPDLAREELQPAVGPSVTSPAEEAAGSRHSPRGHLETPPTAQPSGPPRGGPTSPRREPEVTWTRHSQNLLRTRRCQDLPPSRGELPHSPPQGLTELGGPFPAGQGAVPQQEPTEPTLATGPDSQGPLEHQNSMEGRLQGWHSAG